MKHLEKALDDLKDKAIGNKKFSDFVTLEGSKIDFIIQDGTIKDNGINGVQVTDMLDFTLKVYQSLNSEVPCPENDLTIKYLSDAKDVQDSRTKNRIKRGVEGTSEP
jgi:hypothetical protein